MTHDELERFASGDWDGDRTAFEAEVAADPALRQQLAEAARFELLLRAAGEQATFCKGCGDLVPEAAEGAPWRCDACGAAVAPGGYTVERVLVQGAHGRMYVARDADGTRVALKELAFLHAPSLDAIAAFEREARLLRALEHPAIPRFVASFEEGTGVHVRYYVAQELVDGESLAARLDDHFYTEAELVAIARQVLEVLVYLQGLSPMVIHRDIKPANLLRRADGSIAVVDFGAAHVAGATQGSTSIGTFGYMPVEQLAGLVDATSDGYALGASLLHLASRQEPWRLLAGRFEDVNLSPPLRGWLHQLVAAEPRDRFPNARAALAALERVAGEHVGARHRPTPRIALALGVATVGIAAAGVALAVALREPAEPPAVALAPIGIVPVDAGAIAISADAAVPVADAVEPATHATLRIAMATPVTLTIDGVGHGRVDAGATRELAPGTHDVVIAAQGRSCRQRVTLRAGITTSVACNVRKVPTVDPSLVAHPDDEHPQGRFRGQCEACHTPKLQLVPAAPVDEP